MKNLNNLSARIIPEVFFSFIDHPFRKPSLVLYFCGCYKNCKNCQSPELQDPNFKDCEDITVKELINVISFYLKSYNNIRSIVLLGGEPLLYTGFLINFLKDLKQKFNNLEVVLYTGYLFEEISQELKEYLDFIIDSPYIDNLKTNSFPASLNQRVFMKEKKLNRFLNITEKFTF